MLLISLDLLILCSAFTVNYIYIYVCCVCLQCSYYVTRLNPIIELNSVDFVVNLSNSVIEPVRGVYNCLCSVYFYYFYNCAIYDCIEVLSRIRGEQRNGWNLIRPAGLVKLNLSK